MSTTVPYRSIPTGESGKSKDLSNLTCHYELNSPNMTREKHQCGRIGLQKSFGLHWESLFLTAVLSRGATCLFPGFLSCFSTEDQHMWASLPGGRIQVLQIQQPYLARPLLHFLGSPTSMSCKTPARPGCCLLATGMQRPTVSEHGGSTTIHG